MESREYQEWMAPGYTFSFSPMVQSVINNVVNIHCGGEQKDINVVGRLF